MSLQICNVNPYQFRLTHDISYENLSTCDTQENEFQYGALRDCDSINALQRTTNECNSSMWNETKYLDYTIIDNDCAKETSNSIDYDTSDIWKLAELWQTTLNSNSLPREQNSNSSKEIVCDTLTNKLNDRNISPPQVYYDNTFRTREHFQKSQSDIVTRIKLFDKDILNPLYEQQNEEISTENNNKPTSKTGKRRVRKGRKLPEIPINKKTAHLALSLADELQQADPTLSISHRVHDIPPSTPFSPEELQQIESLGPEEDPILPSYNQNIVDSFANGHFNYDTCELTKSQIENCEFCELVEYIDDEPDNYISSNNLCNGRSISRIDSDSASSSHSANSSPYRGKRSRNTSISQESDTPSFTKKSSMVNCYVQTCDSGINLHNLTLDADDVDESESTHRGCHKFIPRHRDEIEIEIGDPLYVEIESEDLWCEGINLRTGQKGVFPSVYATDLSFFEDGCGMRPSKFKVQFIGSIQVRKSSGLQVIQQAIQKVAAQKQPTIIQAPSPVVMVEINDQGLKMYEKQQKDSKNNQEETVGTRLTKILSKIRQGKQLNHFFSIRNITYSSHNPDDDKYFAFITKHPTQSKFACHVLMSKRSTKVMAEVLNEAYRKHYQQYMAILHHTEDIYLE